LVAAELERSPGSPPHSRLALEDAVGVRILVEVVGGLRLLEPEVSVGDQLGLREVAEVEVFLAQELVPQLGHEGPSRGVQLQS
jgi:hypothetical protein